MTSTHDASSWVSDDVGSVETSDGVVRSLLVVRRPRCRPGPGDAGSLDQQAAAGGPARWPGAPLTGPPPAVRPRQSPAEFRAGKADVAVADQAPAPASNSAKPARLPSSSNSAAVTSPEVSLVTKTASRIRITFLPVAIQPERVHERPGQALITIWQNATSSNAPCREVPEKVTNRGISRSNIVTILSL